MRSNSPLGLGGTVFSSCAIAKQLQLPVLLAKEMSRQECEDRIQDLEAPQLLLFDCQVTKTFGKKWVKRYELLPQTKNYSFFPTHKTVGLLDFENFGIQYAWTSCVLCPVDSCQVKLETTKKAAFIEN